MNKMFLFSNILNKIRSFCGGENADCCLLGYVNVYPNRLLPTFWRNLLLPFSGQKKGGVGASMLFQKVGNHQPECMMS
jgi:hypothetical protein